MTGGTGALGSVIAKRLTTEGARVSASYVRGNDLGWFSEFFEGKVKLIQTDVTDANAVSRLCDEVAPASAGIDIVVNTVGGFLPRKPLVDVTVEEWDSMMDINLKSTFLSAREALRRMKGQAYGRIINLSAMVGLTPTPGRAPYATSKAGVSLPTSSAFFAPPQPGVSQAPRSRRMEECDGAG